MEEQTLIQESPLKKSHKTKLAKRVILVVVSGSEIGKTFLITEDAMTMGRSPLGSFVINDPLVSKEHIIFRVNEEGDVFIEDCKSKNGCYINDKRINKIHQLHYSDKIIVGNTVLRVLQEELQK